MESFIDGRAKRTARLNGSEDLVVEHSFARRKQRLLDSLNCRYDYLLVSKQASKLASYSYFRFFPRGFEFLFFF